MENGIQKAVRAAGSQSALARMLGLTPQAVQKWVEQGYVPSERCRDVVAAVDGQVTRAELNPEIFGPAPEIISPPNKDKSAHP